MNKPAKFALTVLCLFISLQLTALHYTVTNSAYTHLKEINKQWINYVSTAPETKLNFRLDADRIQFHLQLVEKHLRGNSPANISEKAKVNRLILLDKLKHYAAQKQFPTNTYHNVRTPYFIDDFGVYCAVGFLIKESGNDALAQKINEEHRFNYIKDIKTNGLAEWAEKYGFTNDELAWIQPGYEPRTKVSPVYNGVNGPVNEFYNAYYNGNERLVFRGDFDSVNKFPCLNIGVLDKNGLSCFGGGIEGKVNDFDFQSNKAIAVGDLKFSGKNYPLALFNGSNWVYGQIPGRENAIGHFSKYNGDGYLVVISHHSIPGKQELWEMDDSKNTWQKLAIFNGVVNGMRGFWVEGRVYYGSFKGVKIISKTGDETEVNANNVIIDNYYEWIPLASEIKDTIYTAEVIGDAIYFGGKCSDSGEERSCLTKYYKKSIQPLITRDDLYRDGKIFDLALFNKTDLMVGGDCPLWNSRSLLIYDLVYSDIQAFATFGGEVRAISKFDNKWYVGGNMTGSDYYGTKYEYFLSLENTVGLNKDKEHVLDINPYPNPAKNALNINLQNKDFSTIEVYDMLGKMVLRADLNKTLNVYTLDISSLKNGLYILKAVGKDGNTLSSKFEVLK